MLQCVAACCSGCRVCRIVWAQCALQFVAVRCIVLQCAQEYSSLPPSPDTHTHTHTITHTYLSTYIHTDIYICIYAYMYM